VISAFRQWPEKVDCWHGFDTRSTAGDVGLGVAWDGFWHRRSQVFFLISSVLGWIAWHKDKAIDTAAELAVTWTPARERVVYFILTIVSSIGIGFVFDRYTDAHVPYWDAGCAGVSVAAQILMMKRRIESWHLWVIVDVVYTALYATKGAWLTVILYAIFAVIALGGLREWRKSLRKAC